MSNELFVIHTQYDIHWIYMVHACDVQYIYKWIYENVCAGKNIGCTNEYILDLPETYGALF